MAPGSHLRGMDPGHLSPFHALGLLPLVMMGAAATRHVGREGGSLVSCMGAQGDVANTEAGLGDLEASLGSTCSSTSPRTPSRPRPRAPSRPRSRTPARAREPEAGTPTRGGPPPRTIRDTSTPNIEWTGGGQPAARKRLLMGCHTSSSTTTPLCSLPWSTPSRCPAVLEVREDARRARTFEAPDSDGKNRGNPQRRNPKNVDGLSGAVEKSMCRVLGRPPPRFVGSARRPPVHRARRPADLCGRASPDRVGRRQPGERESRAEATKTGKFAEALSVAQEPDKLEAAVAMLKKDFFAQSNQAPVAKKQHDVETLALAVCGRREAFPLRPDTVVKVAAALKAASFRSADQYLGHLRTVHREQDYVVGPALQRTFELCKRAVKRGLGPPTRAPEVQLRDFGPEALECDLTPGALAFPFLTYGFALSFMLRRGELEWLRLGHLTVTDVRDMVTVTIPRSKCDQAEKGVQRSLGCTCSSSPATCPVEVAYALQQSFRRANLLGDHTQGPWITSSSEGEHLSGAHIVNAWARAAGRPLTGHSPRRSGAMFYTRAGLEVSVITYLGRWHSNLVFEYADQAWEKLPINQDGEGPGQSPPKPHVLCDAPGRSCGRNREVHCEAEEVAVVDHPSPGDLRLPEPRWIKSFGRSKVIHLLDQKHRPSDSSATWKTRCGWHFARNSHFTLFLTPPEDSARCKKCRLQKGRRGEP